MKGLRVGACVTVLDRETDRAVHAIAKPFIAVRGYAPNPRFGKDGKLVPDVYWAFAKGRRIRALFDAKEGLYWCRGHVDGAHLEAAWKLARSAR